RDDAVALHDDRRARLIGPDRVARAEPVARSRSDEMARIEDDVAADAVLADTDHLDVPLPDDVAIAHRAPQHGDERGGMDAAGDGEPLRGGAVTGGDHCRETAGSPVEGEAAHLDGVRSIERHGHLYRAPGDLDFATALHAFGPERLGQLRDDLGFRNDPAGALDHDAVETALRAPVEPVGTRDLGERRGVESRAAAGSRG